MKNHVIGRTALKLAGAAILLGATACDPNQAEKEVLAHNAKVEKAQADDKVKRQASYAVECLSAMRWKKTVIASLGAGSVDTYVKHYRERVEKLLGDTAIAAEGGAPELSKGNLDPYLEWAYENDVSTKFTKGRDFNGDGTVAKGEASAPGNARVAACIQQAAEMGVGPLAGPDKTGRMFKMEAIRVKLDKAS